MNFLNWYESTRWHQWWVNTVWKPSWTKFVSAIAGVPAALLAVGQYISNFMQDNTIQGYMAQFDIPNWVPSTLTAVALVYYIASGRK